MDNLSLAVVAQLNLYVSKMIRSIMLKGEMRPKFFKVSFYQSTNWGFEPIGTKYFKTKEDARRYALKLVKESESEMEYYEFIEIGNENDEVVEVWRAEDMGIAYYPNGW